MARSSPTPSTPSTPSPSPRAPSVRLTTGGEFKPPADPILGSRSPYLLQHHPGRWTLFEHPARGFVLAPQLGSLLLVPGVALVKVDRSGAFDVRDATHEKIKRGWTTIPHDIDGPGTTYLAEPLPGVFLSRWEKPYSGSTHVATDASGYLDWLDGLVARGVIPRPGVPVVERLLRSAEDDLAAAIDVAQDNKPSAIRLRERAAARVDVLRRELDAAIARGDA